jgi:hypothetical protein
MGKTSGGSLAEGNVVAYLSYIKKVLGIERVEKNKGHVRAAFTE